MSKKEEEVRDDNLVLVTQPSLLNPISSQSSVLVTLYSVLSSHYSLLSTQPSALIILCLALLITACSPKEEEVVLKESLQQYLEKAQDWAPIEARINGPINAAQRSQFVDDQFVLSTLRPVILIVQDYLKELESYQPETSALRDLHQQYIEAWRSHYLACATIVEAMEKKDYVLLAKGTEDIRGARAALLDALAGLSQLLVEAGLRSPETEVAER
jgi:hypothetical protein